MGPISDDQLHTIFLVNALNDNFEPLQSNIIGLANESNFTSKDVVRRLLQEDQLVRRHAEQNAPATSVSALAAQGQDRPRSLCTHCKKPGHLADFCIRSGGKMAGCSIDEARSAQRAASGKPPRAETPSVSVTGSISSAKVATSDIKSSTTASSGTPDSLVIGGVTYYPGVPSQPSNACVALPRPLAFVTDSDDSGDSGIHPYHTYLAINGPLTASLDWNTCPSTLSGSDSDASPVLSHVPRALLTHAAECPFILNSGASNHISPERSDFKTLQPIIPHPIQGFNGFSTSAIGISDIDLCIGSGHKLLLRDVLFVPSCSTRLVSVSSLTRDGYSLVTFGPKDCWITDKANKIIVRGHYLMTTGLYVLNCPSARVALSKPPPSAMYSNIVPDVETWHRRLGHCSNRTIINMARDKVVKGMPIDLSQSPPKCDHCILGKQTHSPVPKIREGIKASMPLGRVYVDLCGPMPVTSHSGYIYSMNVIDDSISYVWSLPLKRKSDASIELHKWHRAVENQSGHKLQILVTDNGELVSKSMTEWCSLHGIDHQLTAPYTSTHNGRAERLHRTLLSRARAMHLACNALASLWDEFVATAAYLANRTAASSVHGKTPHELLFERVPSLSHLCEIGCRAFSLKQTHTPKLFQRSTPCTLIGYAPKAKAYRLWDNTSDAIFDSFHVTFIEHLHAQPSDLMPGKTVLLNPDAPPSWEVPLPEQNFLPPKPRSSSPAQDCRPIPCSSPIIPVTYSDPISTSAPTVPPQLASVPSQPADAPLPQPVAPP